MKRFLSLALVLLCLDLGGCSVADMAWEPALPTESDAVFAASPETVVYPLTGTPTLSVMADAAQYGDFLRASAAYTGVSLEVTDLAGDGSDQLEVMAAAEELPDVLCQSQLTTGGLDLLAYVQTDAPNYLAAMSQTGLLRDCLLEDGEVTGFYQLTTGSQPADYGPWIRQDWLDALGLETPQTYDQYYAVLCAFRDAYGCTDALLLPASGAVEGDYLAAGYGTSAYVSGRDLSSLGFYVAQGTVKFGPLEDAYWDYAARMNQWYQAGLMSSDFVSYGSDYNQVLIRGDAGLAYLTRSDADNINNYLAQSGGALVPLCDAVLTAGDETHLSTWNGSVVSQTLFTVCEGCADPALAVRWCDYWYSDAGVTLAQYGEQELTYTLDADGAPQYTQAVLENQSGLRSGLCPELAGLYDLDLARSLLSQSDLAAAQVWETDKDSAWRISEDLTLSQADSDRFGDMITAVQTYSASLIDQLILGGVGQDQKEAKRAELRDLGVDKLIACLQLYVDAAG